MLLALYTTVQGNPIGLGQFSMNGGSARQEIIETLKKHPEGLTITAISDLTKLHRHTVTKYVYELRGAEIIYEREIGPARLCYLKNGCMGKKEKKAIKRLQGHDMKSSLGSIGQIQLIAVFIFLVLAPAAIITAYNLTNTTENSPISIEGYVIANNEVTSETGEDFIGDFLLNITNETFEQNETNGTPSLPSDEEIEIALQNENNQTNETTENGTVDFDEILNETMNMTEPMNESNVTIFIPEIMILLLNYPSQVNVSEEFFVSSEIKSLYGKSENVKIKLTAPESFWINTQNQEIPFLEENSSAGFEWRAKANECGNYTLAISACNDIHSLSKNFTIFVECNFENLSIEYEMLQGEAVVDKPVIWKKIAKITNKNYFDVANFDFDMKLPEESQTIRIKNKFLKMLNKIFDIC